MGDKGTGARRGRGHWHRTAHSKQEQRPEVVVGGRASEDKGIDYGSPRYCGGFIIEIH